MGKLVPALLIATFLIGPVQNAFAQTPAAHHQPAGSTAAPVAPASAPSNVPAPPPADTPPAPGSSYGRLFGLVFGLIVAGGVIWFVLRLIKNRGEMLIDIARKAGVDVPNIDDEIPLAATSESPQYKPKPPIEKIPEEATKPPVIPAASLRPHSVASQIHAGSLRIVALEGVASGSTFGIIADRMSIGRDGDNDIVLTDSTVSRHHAIITKDAKGTLTIQDGGSSNGILINGAKINTTTLYPGDEIKIGDNYFRLEGS